MNQHEVQDASARGIVWAGIFFILFMLMVHFGLEFFFRAIKNGIETALPHTVEKSLINRREKPPLPRLQVDPSLDLKIYQAQQQKLLNSFGWIHQKARIAHIPIEQAMEIQAHEQ